MTNLRVARVLLALLLPATLAAAQTGVHDPAEINAATQTQADADARLPAEAQEEFPTAGKTKKLLQGLNLSVGGSGATSGGQAIVNVSWTGTSGHTYKLCWKRTNQGGDACNHNKIVDIDANDPGVTIGSSSTWHMSVYATCSTGYHFKLKREGSLTNYDKNYTTPPCCAVKCPSGGWFDGANCQVGQAPSGTKAFIWGGNYYYTPRPPPGPKCLQGSWYDGANCFVQPVPAGVQPFIWSNHWYYKACP